MRKFHKGKDEKELSLSSEDDGGVTYIEVTYQVGKKYIYLDNDCNIS